MTVKELLEKRANLVEQARAIQDKADQEKRELTTEEAANFDKYLADAHELGDKANDAQVSAERAKKLANAEAALRSERPKGPRTEADPIRRETGDAGKEKAENYRRAFEAHLRWRPQEMESELRALQADLDVSGGYLVPPPEFNSSVIEAVRDRVLMRQLGNVVSISGTDAIEWPTLDTRPEDPDWTSEIGTIDLDTATAFGKRAFAPHKLTKAIILSEKLVQLVPSAEGLVRDLMAYKFAVTEESAYMSGSGAGRPLGIFTASAQGISTGRDVSTGNTTTSIQFDNLLTVRGTLKDQYRARAAWVFHRDGVTQITKLKDGEGRYIWQPSATAGRPDTLLGHSVFSSEYAPNTFTTGLYVGMFADFSFYRIVDFGGANIMWKRHNEYLAGTDLSGTDQVGFSARKWTDGGPVIEEAFVRVKLA